MIRKKLQFQSIILIIFSLLIVFAELWYANDIYNMYKNNKKEYERLISECEKIKMTASNFNCESSVSVSKPIMPDTISLFFIVIINTKLNNIQILAPIIIIIISSYTFYQTHKENFNKNIIQSSYKENLKNTYLNALKCIWIFPASLLILFIVCFIMSGHFSINKTLSYYSEIFIPISINHITIFIPFIIIYIFNIIINSWFYVNITALTIKKDFNFITSTLLAYIIFLFSDALFEVIIGRILFEHFFNIQQASKVLNLFNYWVYEGITSTQSLTAFTMFNVAMALLSFGLLYYKIYNKESPTIERMIIKSEPI